MTPQTASAEEEGEEQVPGVQEFQAMLSMALAAAVPLQPSPAPPVPNLDGVPQPEATDGLMVAFNAAKVSNFALSAVDDSVVRATLHAAGTVHPDLIPSDLETTVSAGDEPQVGSAMPPAARGVGGAWADSVRNVLDSEGVAVSANGAVRSISVSPAAVTPVERDSLEAEVRQTGGGTTPTMSNETPAQRHAVRSSQIAALRDESTNTPAAQHLTSTKGEIPVASVRAAQSDRETAAKENKQEVPVASKAPEDSVGLAVRVAAHYGFSAKDVSTGSAPAGVDGPATVTRVVEAAQTAKAKGVNTLEVELKPEGLGTIRLILSSRPAVQMAAPDLRLEIRATTAAAHALLSAHMGEIREALSQWDVRMGSAPTTPTVELGMPLASNGRSEAHSDSGQRRWRAWELLLPSSKRGPGVVFDVWQAQADEA